MVLIDTNSNCVIPIEEKGKAGTVSLRWAKFLIKGNPRTYKLGEPVAKKEKPVEAKIEPVEVKEVPENTASISKPVEPPKKKRGRRPTKKS